MYAASVQCTAKNHRLTGYFIQDPGQHPPSGRCTLSTPFFSAGLVHGFQTRPTGPPDLTTTRGKSIDADLTIVFAASVVSRYQTGWSIKRFASSTPPLPNRQN